MSETILTAENLKFRYDAEQPVYALDGVSAQVKRGEFVAVLGANGCGKSTLAKHFNAISGTIWATLCLPFAIVQSQETECKKTPAAKSRKTNASKR